MNHRTSLVPALRCAALTLAALPLALFLSRPAAAQVSETLVFAPIADTYVESTLSTTNFNADARLSADASPIRVSYLRFAVTGVNGRPVQQARLRLGVSGASASGGTVHRINDNSWDEATVTYRNRPAVDGPGLSTLGAVAVGAVVDFNLGAAIPGDGVYSLAIDTTSTDGVSYVSTFATSGQKPVLILTVPAGPNPTVSILQPPSGSTFFVGDPITFQGTATDAQDGDLSASIGWSSDLEGPLGTGASLTATLGQGNHQITAAVTDRDGFTGSAALGIAVKPPPPANTAPLVAITAPIDGQVFAAGTITFSGTADDLEDGTLSARLTWTSDLDGTLGTGASFTRTLSTGAHHVTAAATDSGGLTGSLTVGVTVRAPTTVELTPVADAYVDAGLPASNFGASPLLRVDANTLRIAYLRFAVSGVGAAVSRAILRLQVDTATSANSVSGGTVQAISNNAWDERLVTFNTKPVLDGPALATAGVVALGQLVDFDVSAAVTGDGTYNFAVVNSSSDGADYRSREGSQAPKLILTLSGSAPVVAITAPPDGSAVVAGQPLTLRGTANDAEDGDLSTALTWTSSLDGALGAGATLTTAALRVGTHTLTAVAIDSTGRSGQAQVTLVVRAPNTAPSVTITAPANGAQVIVGTPVTLTGTAVDDYDGNLSAALTWSSDLQGPLGTGASVNATLVQGNHVITAAVTDSGGLRGSAQIGVAILPPPPNTAPTVTIAAPANGATAVAGLPVMLAGTALDDYDGNLSASLRWASSLQGPLGTGASLSVMLAEGSHVLTAAATDSAGLGGSAQISITVLPASTNVAPTVLITAPRDGQIFTAGEATSFGGAADDREDGLLTAGMTWTSDRDGALGTGGALTRALSAGTHRITAVATDTGGLRTAAAVTVSVVAPVTLKVGATADTYVDSGKPTKAYGLATTLAARSSGPVQQSFLRFAVRGVPPYTVARALLRLTVGSGSGDGSSVGGTVHTITSSSWSEAKTTYNNTRPAIDGPALATRGSVAPNQVVDFDVTAAVRGDGTYNFALISSSTNVVRYRSREATTGKPELVITLGSPRITLTGTFASSYSNGSLPLDATIDARAASFLASLTNNYPLNLAGGAGVWFSGGAVLGQFDRSWSWDQMHTLNSAGIAFANGQMTIDSLRIDDVSDAVRPENGGAFAIRNAHLSYVRDNCVENDHLHAGLVDDSLFDGCYNGFSARPSPAIILGGANGAANVWHIHNSLVRLQAMPGPRASSPDNLGHDGFFKWDSWDDPTTSLSPKLALHGNVFMAERVGQVGAPRMGIPPGQLVSCSNNVMVWLGPGAYPAPLPACFTVTTNRAVWDNAVADWLRRHPQVAP